MNSQDYILLDEAYAAHTYHPLDVVVERGKGVWVYDVDGRQYLDCLSAYSAVNQGHCHPAIIAAAHAQMQRVTLTSRAFYNDQLGPFLRDLCELTGYEMGVPMNSGAEAVETAIKAARMWGYRAKGVPRNQAEIIVCEGNFAGRTTTLISFSSEAAYKEDFGPHTPGFVTIPYGDAEALERAITPHTVGFLVEPIQGEGGVIIPPPGYLRAAKAICERHNVLFIADEIQTGLGRTGAILASHHEDVRPDLVTLGKALSGGFYPISAVVGDRRVLGLFRPGDHGSTFGGNPLASAIGREALRVLVDEGLVERSREMGAYFLGRLQRMEADHIVDVRGKGLLIGVQLDTPARPYCEALRDAGVLCKDTHETVVRFAPPLVINRQEIDWAMERIEPILSNGRPHNGHH
jgi:ornithine--oxo-acid transaminase